MGAWLVATKYFSVIKGVLSILFFFLISCDFYQTNLFSTDGAYHIRWFHIGDTVIHI